MPKYCFDGLTNKCVQWSAKKYVHVYQIFKMYKMYSKDIQTKTEFNKTEINNAWHIIFLKNCSLSNPMSFQLVKAPLKLPLWYDLRCHSWNEFSV